MHMSMRGMPGNVEIERWARVGLSDIILERMHWDWR